MPTINDLFQIGVGQENYDYSRTPNGDKQPKKHDVNITFYQINVLISSFVELMFSILSLCEEKSAFAPLKYDKNDYK